MPYTSHGHADITLQLSLSSAGDESVLNALPTDKDRLKVLFLVIGCPKSQSRLKILLCVDVRPNRSKQRQF